MTMRTFRTLDQAKRDLEEIQEYVQLIENYQPQDFAQKVILTYAIEGNISKVSAILNSQGYSIEGNMIEPENISEMITNKPKSDDLLHKRIRTLYFKKTRQNRKSGRNKNYNY